MTRLLEKIVKMGIFVYQRYSGNLKNQGLNTTEMGEKCSGRALVGLEAMTIGPANAIDKIAKLSAIPRFQISIA
jgi:hypothetical protein